MKTNKICLGFLLGLCLISTAAYSQEAVIASTEKVAVTPAADETAPIEGEEEKQEAPAFTFSGSVDSYFHSSFGVTNAAYGDINAPATSFADLKGFGLGMANLIATYGGEKVGFTADLVFGPRGRAAVFGSSQGIVNQMYAYYKLTDKVTLNLGQFNTFLGYEVISPAVNFHYSTSYMFSWGPFNHTGLRADFDLGGGMVAKLAVMNPTDVVEFNPVNTYTIGGQIGHANDAGGVWLNLIYGDQDGNLKAEDDPYVYDENGTPIDFISSMGSLFQIDLTTGWNLSEKFYLGLNTTYQTVAAGEAFIAEGDLQDSNGDASTFMGFALYPKITLSETFALGLRGEYLGVTNGHLGIFGLDADNKGSVMEFTLSGNYKVGGLTFIPEFRIDTTSEDSFLDADGNATNMMPSLNLAAVYKF
ncbi:MAG: outer membrane beta-barrel protein [Cyclobacteriaceae bacterium]